MPLLQSLVHFLQTQLLPRLPAPLRAVFEGGAQKQLLATIRQSLVLIDSELVHLETGRSVSIEAHPTQEIANSNPAEHFATCLAKAAAKLIRNNNSQSNGQSNGQAEGEGIILYLPPSEFLATSINMPGVGIENLRAALKLQADNLFPSFNQPLDLTLANHDADDGTRIALWHTEQSTNTLFDALKNENCYLVAVAPRNLLNRGHSAVADYDGKGATLVELKDGAVQSWLHINQLDMIDDELNKQWRDALALHSETECLNLRGIDSFANLSQWEIPTDHCFFTEGALQSNKRQEKKRNLSLAAAACLVVLMMAAVPFVIQSIQFRALAASLNEQRAESAQARENRSVVVNFENEWGPVTDFPIQEVEQAMFTLQRILQPDQLSSFELSEGVIKIQGTSSEPQAILQRLEQDPMFTEVVFSRATNNNRYYIDLRLSTVNFEGYMVRHFPDA